MDLSPYVDAVRADLDATAAAGTEEAQATARLLSGALDASLRLALLDALSALAAEVTASGDVEVELRMHGRDPQVVVTAHPPLEDEAHCVQRLGIGRELRHPLVDLSAGGLSIRMSVEETPPAPGRIWRQSRIETAASLVIPCELVARGVYEDPALEGARRVAFAFHAMPSDVLRRVQMYVIDIEKRLRRDG